MHNTNAAANAPALVVRKPRGRQRAQLRAWLNADAEQTLAYLRTTYAAMAGQEVSTSPIIRRALTVLADHLRGNQGDTQAELAALVRALR